MNKIALRAKDLTKVYEKAKGSHNSTLALNKLNLEVIQGEIFGLLGPNGAGKTTFINILGGLVVKTSGVVNVWGFDLDDNPRQVRASVGIVPQEVNLDAFFSPKKLLELQAGLYGVKKKRQNYRNNFEDGFPRETGKFLCKVVVRRNEAKVINSKSHGSSAAGINFGRAHRGC